jgi:hypothetical protein
MKLKDENQTDIITDQHSPDLGQAHEMWRGYISYKSTQPSSSRSQRRIRGRLLFRSTLAYTLYLVLKRLKHKSLLRCKASHSHVFFPNQKINRKEYFTKIPRVFQTATVLNLLTRQQSSKYNYQVCGSSNYISCLKFLFLEKKCWGIINLDNHYRIKPRTL